MSLIHRRRSSPAPGARAVRIGHLYPSGGICEHEPQMMAPAGVRFLTTRMPFSRTGLEDDLALLHRLEHNAALLADAQVDLIAVNCTAATMLLGADEINRRVSTATGLRSVTTIEAVVAALQHCGMRRIALLTPYPPAVVDAEIRFFGELGIRVVAHGGTPCSTPVEQGEIAPLFWLRAGRELSSADCDGLLLSCAGIQVAAVLDELESHWRRPVIASNQALLWHCLRTLGVAVNMNGFGRLLAGGFDGRH
jgi:maleate isomerase